MDSLGRIYMLDAILRLDPKVEKNVENAVNLFRDLRKISMEDNHKVHFQNTEIHLKQFRAWSFILSLHPLLFDGNPLISFCREEEIMQQEQSFGSGRFVALAPEVWDSIRNEGIPSTRFLMEWFLVLGYLKYPSQLPLLVQRLDFGATASTAVSVMTVIYHVSRRLSGKFVDFQRECLENLVPFLVHNSQTVRGFAIFTIQSFVTRQAEGWLQNLYLKLQGADHCRKFTAKIASEPCFRDLDAVDDFDLEFIFCEYPRRAGVSHAEFISGAMFRAVHSRPLLIPFGEPRPQPKPSQVKPEEPEPLVMFRDYQQKIAMWDLALLDEELGALQRRAERDRRRKLFGETIVVGSLVDKIPNLGGLSRSCEIFAVSTLTVPSEKVQSHPDFQCLAMTSDRWLDISVVPPQSLESFLLSKKDQGFRILAIEQCGNSHPLQEFNFTENDKNVLVLGNEREGIPPEILNCVDDAIEIPQFGKIRSLNVHVTGSLVLWEMRRQKLIKK